MPSIAEPVITNPQSASLKIIVDRNTLVWWGLILTSVLIAVTISPWGCLFWLFALALDDVLLYGFGKSILFDSQLRMRRNYQWMHNMYDGITGSGRDLGFNLVVDSNLSQRAKFEHMAKELGLEKGMVICDVGCGYGDWLKYCRDEIGCEAVGINITPEQADFAEREYGLEVHVTNWKDILTNSEYVQEGRVTEQGVEELRKRMPFANLDGFAQNPVVQDFPNLLTVADMCRFVQGKVEVTD